MSGDHCEQGVALQNPGWPVLSGRICLKSAVVIWRVYFLSPHPRFEALSLCHKPSRGIPAAQCWACTCATPCPMVACVLARDAAKSFVMLNMQTTQRPYGTSLGSRRPCCLCACQIWRLRSPRAVLDQSKTRSCLPMSASLTRHG